MKKELSKAIALAALFTFLFAFFGLQYAGGGDYSFHFEKAKSNCENQNADCEIYAPLFHWIASPFTFHPNAFFFFTVFLIGFVTPMLLFLLSKNWLTVWFYYSTTSYYWFMIDGIFAQALAMILLLTVLVLKDWKHQAFIVLIAILSHGSGFFLVLITFIIKNMVTKENVSELLNELKKEKEKWVKIIPCSGIFGLQKPLILKEQVGNLISTGKPFTFADLLIPFIKIFPLPFTFLAVKQALKDKNYHIIALVIVILITGLWVSHRVFYALPLVLIPSLTNWVKTLNSKHRVIFLLITLGVFGLQLYSWFNFKLVCSS